MGILTEEKISQVYIEFYDHLSEASWMDKPELEKFTPVKVYQTGWLSGEDKLCYKVSGQITADGSFGDTIAILKSTVIKIKKFNVKL